MSRKEKFAKIYREFTRVKFEKYRLQFPRSRETELIEKIIKEWEAMDDQAKYDLQRKYDQGSGVNFSDSPSSSEKRKQELKAKDEQPASARLNKNKKIKKVAKPPSPKVKVFVESSMKKSSPEELADFDRKDKENSKSPGKKSTPDKGISSSSELAINKAKSDAKAPEAKIKSKAEEFQSFYKYYYERLVVEHPRWNKQQISTIIKLLWRKRSSKTNRRRKMSSSTTKSLSGRQLYSRTKKSEGLLRDEIRQLWRALPHESKKYWSIKGQGKPNRNNNLSGSVVRRILSKGVSEQARMEEEQKLSWMNNQMK